MIDRPWLLAAKLRPAPVAIGSSICLSRRSALLTTPAQSDPAARADRVSARPGFTDTAISYAQPKGNEAGSGELPP